MLIYYGLLAGLLLVGVPLCSIKPNKRKSGIYVLLAAAALSAISGPRFLVGWDTPYYAELYSKSAFFDWPEMIARREEKGYITANWLLSSWSINFSLWFWVIAIVVAVSVMLYIYRYSSNYWLSAFAFVAFGFLYNSMCFMRQILAAMIIMWALRYVEEHRFWRFAAFVLLASCFHISALILLPFYFILLIPINKFVLPVYLAISIGCYYFSWQIIDFITDFYYSGYQLTNVHVLGGLPIAYSIGFFLLFLFCFAVRKELIEKRKLNGILLNCLFFGTLFEFIGSKHSVISRVALLFMIPPVIILISDAAEAWSNRLKKLPLASPKKFAPVLVCGVLVLLMVVFHQYLMIHNYNGVVPYRIQ